MINHYHRLGVSLYDTDTLIRKKYYQRAKHVHPDKHPHDPSKTQEFQELSEAYSVLSNPRKRFLYDIQCIVDILGISFDISHIHFHDEEMDILYDYYKSWIHSVECRFLYTFIQSIPHGISWEAMIKQIMKRLSTKVHSKDTLVSLQSRKTIDCRKLQEDFVICLQRSLSDVYHNVCKEIIFVTRESRYHLFITHSDYTLYIANGPYTVSLAIETNVSQHVHLNGSDIHVSFECDLYDYFFETLSFPSPWTHLSSKQLKPSLKPYTLYNSGLRNTGKNIGENTGENIGQNTGQNTGENSRGNLIIHTHLQYHMNMEMAHTHKLLLKQLLSTKLN